MTTPEERYFADVMQRREMDPRSVHAHTRHPFGDLVRFQAEQKEWCERNFGEQESWEPMLGLTEEAGEFVEAVLASAQLQEVIGRLSHLTLKHHQGIRGSSDELEAEAQDAVGDMLVFLTSYCTLRGWSLADILLGTWAEVRMRDWRNHATNGVAEEDEA